MAADTIDFPFSTTAGGAPTKTFSLCLDNLAAVADPAVGNDDSQGYAKGSRWINTSAKTDWVCVDNTTGAAVWHQTDATGVSGAAGGDLAGTYPNPTLSASGVLESQVFGF